MKKEIKLRRLTDKTTVIFDPSTPFIEVPEFEWNFWYRVINQRIKNDLLLNCDIDIRNDNICTREGTCVYKNTCEELSKCANIRLSLGLQDVSHRYKLIINMTDLLIDGRDINPWETGTCYIAIMKQANNAHFYYRNSWIIGSLLFKSYYVVFDMTPYQFDKNKIYNRIGLAVKKEIILGQQNTPIDWQKTFIKGSFIFTGFAVVISLMIFIFCKYYKDKIDFKIRTNDMDDQGLEDIKRNVIMRK